MESYPNVEPSIEKFTLIVADPCFDDSVWQADNISAEFNEEKKFDVKDSGLNSDRCTSYPVFV
jgi:hypothetical protein